MAEFFGLVVSLIFLAFVLLPVLSFLRLGRLSRELEDLAARVKRLETQGSPVAPVAPVHRTAPVAPVAPVASASARAQSQASFGETAPERPQGREGGPDAPDAPDLESRIGGRGLLYTGVVALLFGMSFFLKYAFDNAWINETGRIVLGTLAGFALVAGGLRLANRGLVAFGQALSGTGLAILYLVIFAAINLYALIDRTTAFAGMGLVTLGAAALADRQRSQSLAFIAVGGGFLTPFLVGGDQNAQLTLFTYDALLVGGTLLLAFRHQWLALNAASYVFTFLTVLVWTARYYTADQWLRTLLFLTLFCVLFLIILRETARIPGIMARLVSGLISTAPLVYHLSAVVMTAAHPPAIHVYLILFTVAGLWLTVEPHRPWIRLLVLLGGFAPLFGTLTLPDGLSWILPNVVTIIAVAALHTLAILDRIVRQEEQLALADLLALHLTGLGLFAVLYEALQPAYPDFRGGLAAIVAFGAIGLWQWLQARDRVAALNAAALAFTLAALGVAVQFDGPAVVVGWAAEGAAAAWLGLRAPSLAFQFGGLVLWGFAALRLFDDGYFETPVSFTAILNARAITTFFVVALGYAIARLFNRSDAPGAGRTRAALHVAASVLTITWLTAEIHSYWEVRQDSVQASLYEQMMRSLVWGLYGAVLVALGMRRGYPPIRYIGITVIAITVLKVFLYDLWALGGIYRVIGFMGFGVLLMLVSYLYQKRRTTVASGAQPSNSEP